MRRIGVFCSSRIDVRPEYVEAARNLGAEIGRRGLTLVYGGSRGGLMHVVSRATRAAGGKTVGIIPQTLVDRGMLDDVDVAFHTASLDDRKAAMIREADVLIALPGGIGTLDEIFTTIAAATLGYHAKTVILYNVCGFWNPVVEMLRHIDGEGMLAADMPRRLVAVSTPEELHALVFRP